MKMKNLGVGLLLILGVALQSPAYGAYWALSPTGEVDVTGETEITFELSIVGLTSADIGAALLAPTWDVDIGYDPSELELAEYVKINPWDPEGFKVEYVYTDPVGTQYGAADPMNATRWSADSFSAAGLSIPNIYLIPGTHIMAEITFDLINPDILNGSVEPDVWVVSNFGGPGYDKGFWDDANNIHRFDGSEGADVATIPIPGALLLLGSGLLCLIGIKRKKH
jgi:hypothetical protein